MSFGGHLGSFWNDLAPTVPVTKKWGGDQLENRVGNAVSRYQIWGGPEAR